ncbi:MAG: IS21 family transposase, partial [Patescibacteria group bacterium]
KQRLTAARLHEMLVKEEYEVGETIVKACVREWKRRGAEVFVPLEYVPGDLAEVDFFEVLVTRDGVRRKCHLFVMRLMYSGRDYARIYDRQDQVSFLDGHARAFEHFGGIPKRILYDNLKAAVVRILAGRERELAPRFKALVTHYTFTPCFARPGTGHDKGGVESRGRSIRLRYLVPIPEGASLEEINAGLLQKLTEKTSDEVKAAEEKTHLTPLPLRPFNPALVRSVMVSRRCLVKIDAAEYSVPERWASLEITAAILPDRVRLTGPDGTIEHPRMPKGQRIVDFRHYLRELSRKPNALRQVAKSLMRDLGEPYGAVWDRLVEAHGPDAASRQFAEILRRIISQGDDVIRGHLRGCLESGRPFLIALAPRTGGTDLPEAYRTM